jgi:hypothetical protein
VYDILMNDRSVDVTDAEVSAAIRYLDPNSNEKRGRESSAFIAIWVSLLLLVSYIALVCLSHRIA